MKNLEFWHWVHHDFLREEMKMGVRGSIWYLGASLRYVLNSRGRGQEPSERSQAHTTPWQVWALGVTAPLTPHLYFPSTNPHRQAGSVPPFVLVSDYARCTRHMWEKKKSKSIQKPSPKRHLLLCFETLWSLWCTRCHFRTITRGYYGQFLTKQFLITLGHCLISFQSCPATYRLDLWPYINWLRLLRFCLRCMKQEVGSDPVGQGTVRQTQAPGHDTYRHRFSSGILRWPSVGTEQARKNTSGCPRPKSSLGHQGYWKQLNSSFWVQVQKKTNKQTTNL